MIRQSRYPVEDEREPHAIIYRNLHYFSDQIREAIDDLDYFQYCAFDKGNQTAFDVRRYKGDPSAVVSIYLPMGLGDFAYIVNIVDEILNGFRLPRSSIGWKRSLEPDFDHLSRAPDDRLREAEARILALKIASQQPDRTASTKFIKRHINEYYTLTEKDKTISKTRSKEQLWQQVIGNVISHRKSSEGPFRKKYAVRTHDGLTVTEKGMDYLKSIGFTS
ncbi:hypothetical protein [Methylorubrum extorquens]